MRSTERGGEGRDGIDASRPTTRTLTVLQSIDRGRGEQNCPTTRIDSTLSFHLARSRARPFDFGLGSYAHLESTSSIPSVSEPCDQRCRSPTYKKKKKKQIDLRCRHLNHHRAELPLRELSGVRITEDVR